MPRTTAPSSNPPTFTWLLATYQRPVYRFLLRLCAGRRADAEDLCQETFLRAYRAFDRLAPDAHHRGWVYRIAYNAFLNDRRPANRTVALVEDVPAPAREDERDEIVAAIGAFVQTLPQKQRTALLLRHVEGREYAEIAAVLACSEDSARANVFQALKKVRARFQREYRE